MKCLTPCALAFAVHLVACAQEGPTPPASPVKAPAASGAPASTAPLRVVLQLHGTVVDGRVFADKLQERTHVPVRYVASISSTTHVYLLHPPASQAPGLLLQQLRSMPEVGFAELDAKTRAP